MKRASHLAAVTGAILIISTFDSRAFAADADRPAIALEWSEAAAELSSEPTLTHAAPAASPAAASPVPSESMGSSVTASRIAHGAPDVMPTLSTAIAAPRGSVETFEPAIPAAAVSASRGPVAGDSTVEIPQALVEPLPDDLATASSSADPNPEIARYQSAQTPPRSPEMRGIKEFIAQGVAVTPLGLEVREARRKLRSGEAAEGLLILNVKAGSAAQSAGLRSYQHTTHDMIAGAAVAAAMAFPPAILVLPMLDYSEIGESYDMIIGIDGNRVTNFLEFEDLMRKVNAGQLVYLSILRNGDRVQVAVRVPTDFTAVSY
ncbi:MAG: PDZ domain-containing protein [Candidatus Binataceae bacterium]